MFQIEMALARERMRIQRTEIITTGAGLESLENSWKELVEDLPETSLFLTWDWVNLWRKHFSHEGDLWIFTAWDEAGKLIGLAPWMLSQARLGPLRLRCVQFIVTRPPLHQDILARAQDWKAVSDAFIQGLFDHQDEWDLLNLRGLREGSALKEQLQGLNGCSQGKELNNLYIPTDEDWETYQKNVLSHNQRKSIRYYHNRIEREYPGQTVFQRVRHQSELDDALNVLKAQNRDRQHSKGFRSAFDDDHFVQFNREFASLALEQDWLRLYQLKVGDQVIATEFGLRYRQVFYSYHTGFDLDWRKFSPGQLMLAHLVKQAFAEGASEVDLLFGKHPYKLAWTNQERRNSHLLFALNRRGRAWLAASGLLDTLVSNGRNLFSETARQKINGLLSYARKPAAEKQK